MFNLLEMSRIGQQPISIPSGVRVETEADKIVKVSGPKGDLQQALLDKVSFKLDKDQCLIERNDESKRAKSQHGLMRSLLANMVVGVSEGFSRELEIVGIGYKVRLEGGELVLNLGFSHEIRYQIPETVEVTVDGNFIKVSGIDKQQVGQVAASIRGFKKPEPYKGKGIRYKGEVIRRKSGKGAKEA